MKITHSTKVKASTNSDYITDSYGRKVFAPKPVGGDGENYISYYTGHGYAGPKEILEDAKQRGFSKIYWGSDEAYGMHGMYNGDMYIAYNDAEMLPNGYKEDALDAEAHNSVMAATILECATQEEMQQAFAEYQKKQEEMMSQLDNMQNDQLGKFNRRTQGKKKGFFQRAFGSEDNPVCHRVSEDEDSINYVVGSEDIIAGTKWMGKYLTTDGVVKKVYFAFDSEDWNEAEQEFEDIIPEPYQSCKLLGTAPIGIESEEDFEYIESATRASNSSQIINELQSKLSTAVHRYMVDVGGFDEERDPDDKYSMPADDLWRIDISPVTADDGAKGIYIELGAELGYESTERLLDTLNPIVKQYDKEAYFEPYDPGISVCYLWNLDNISSSTDVKAASPVSDTRDHWLEPEDEDDLDELPPYQETIEVELDVDIDIEDDGSYDYESYDFAKNDSFNGDYYVSYDDLADKVKLRDYMSVVEDIDELLVYKLPQLTGKHHISGIAELVYDVDGLVRDNSDGLVYAYDPKITFNRSDSSIKKLHIN